MDVNIVTQEFEMVPLDGDTDRLKEHPQNPRRGDMGVINESLAVNGFYGAVVAQRSTGYILAGNHRYRAALQKDAIAVPTLWVDVGDEEALRILLVDNKSADAGGYDEEALTALLESLPSLEGTGYGLGLVQEEEEAEPPAPEPEPPPVPENSHESQWGVIVMCVDEDHQRALYEWLKVYVDEGLERAGDVCLFEDATLRVVAI